MRARGPPSMVQKCSGCIGPFCAPFGTLLVLMCQQMGLRHGARSWKCSKRLRCSRARPLGLRDGGSRLWSRSRHTEREEEAGWAKVSHRTTHTYTRERRKTRRPQASVPQGGTQICGGGGASGPRKSHPYMRTRRGGRLLGHALKEERLVSKNLKMHAKRKPSCDQNPEARTEGTQSRRKICAPRGGGAAERRA